MMLGLNIVTRGIGFLGTAYAARCLGPANFGISALVQNTALQTEFVFDGGFDTIGARRIAGDKRAAQNITATIIAARLCGAAVSVLIWLVVIAVIAPPGGRFPWIIGSVQVLVLASTLVFAFQGLEKLPIYSLITTGTTLLTSACYFCFFHPGMRAGSDLAVLSSVGVFTWATSWWLFRRVTGKWPFALSEFRRLAASVGDYLRESWKYWIAALMTFCYSVFQIGLVAHLLGPTSAGLFRAAYQQASALDVLFTSVSSLLLARFVNWRLAGKREMWRKQSLLFTCFACAGIPISLALMLFAPPLYRILLGKAFAGSVAIFQIMVIGRLIAFLGQAYGPAMAAVGLDWEGLMLTTGVGCFSVLSTIIVGPIAGLTGVAWVFVLSEVFAQFGSYFIIRRHLQ